MKTSFITTVFNEEQTIRHFLDSLYEQNTLPDEIIIVDALSTDQTATIIQEYFNQHTHIPGKLIKKFTNRSAGRNEAIQQAQGNIILCSDAGCVLQKNWIKHILEIFEKHDTDIDSGYYKPLANTVFERSLATYTCVMPDKLDVKNFLPSSRSIAFTKTAWEKVNGYPEMLDTCEDLVFAKNLKKAGMRFVFAEYAIVHWRQQKNFLAAGKQFFSYAHGDGKARHIRPQVLFLYARYFFLFMLLILFLSKPQIAIVIFLYAFLVYTLWAIGKNYRYVKHWQALYILPLLQITADIAVLSGTAIGLLDYLIEKYYPNVTSH